MKTPLAPRLRYDHPDLASLYPLVQSNAETAYVTSGYAYGDNAEGFVRWLKEPAMITGRAPVSSTISTHAQSAALAYLPDCHNMAGESLRRVLTEERTELAQIVQNAIDAATAELTHALSGLVGGMTLAEYEAEAAKNGGFVSSSVGIGLLRIACEALEGRDHSS